MIAAVIGARAIEIADLPAIVRVLRSEPDASSHGLRDALLTDAGLFSAWVAHVQGLRHDGEIIGYVHVTESAEISIALLPEYRGRGAGTEALRWFCYGPAWARVRLDNPAAIRAFTKAGFRRDGEVDGCVLFRAP